MLKIVAAMALVFAAGPAQDGAIASFEPMSWITSADYPTEALKAKAEGRVVFLIDIGEDGRPTACSIVRTSGSKVLDDTTCALVRRRATFKSDGPFDPTSPFRVGYYDWRLPR